jgi:hypothetical protein
MTMRSIRFQGPTSNSMALLTATILRLFLVMMIATATTVAAVASETEKDNNNPAAKANLRRQLPGYDGFQGFGGMAGMGGSALLVIVVLLVLCCLCSGRSSICDILACVCIYEMCCDDGNIGGFNLF